jgi:small nuclear ribonucleoprotein (snRNP)-like protein
VVLNTNRHVTGTLRGFDQFMNVVLDQTVDMKTKTDIGMVVRCFAVHGQFGAADSMHAVTSNAGVASAARMR